MFQYKEKESQYNKVFEENHKLHDNILQLQQKMVDEMGLQLLDDNDQNTTNSNSSSSKQDDELMLDKKKSTNARPSLTKKTSSVVVDNF